MEERRDYAVLRFVDQNAGVGVKYRMDFVKYM